MLLYQHRRISIYDVVKIDSTSIFSLVTINVSLHFVKIVLRRGLFFSLLLLFLLLLLLLNPGGEVPEEVVPPDPLAVVAVGQPVLKG